MVAGVQKSPANTGQFEIRPPDPLAERRPYSFPTTSPRTSDEVLLVCWPTPNRTELQTEFPLRTPNLAARGAERMRSVPQWRGMQCGLDPKVGPKDIHAVWVGTRRSDTEKSMPCGRWGQKKSMQCGLDPKVGHREIHAFVA